MGQTHSGLPECDSRPSISTESAHNNRVESPPRNSEPDLGDMGNSNSGHVSHSPQHASSPVKVSNSRASSTGDTCSVTRQAREVNEHVSHAQQSHSETTDHPGGRSDTIAPWIPSQSWFPHLLHLCVDHPLIIPYHWDLLLEQGMSRMESHTICTHGDSHAALPSSRFFKGGL